MAKNIIEIYNKDGSADRLNTIITKRAIKNSERLKSSSFSMSISGGPGSIRPGFKNPNFSQYPSLYSKDSKANKYSPGQNAFGIRRPYNPTFINQVCFKILN